MHDDSFQKFIVTFVMKNIFDVSEELFSLITTNNFTRDAKNGIETTNELIHYVWSVIMRTSVHDEINSFPIKSAIIVDKPGTTRNVARIINIFPILSFIKRVKPVYMLLEHNGVGPVMLYKILRTTVVFRIVDVEITNHL